MKKVLLIAAALGVSTPALALDGAKLYQDKTCWSCHGKDAKTPLKGMPYPKLAGQNASYAEAQMKDIKSGARNNGQSAAMKGVMGLVSDEEIKAIAEYLSKLK
ncbi:MAG: c-type cytochrome [Rhodocyclaceae bacterium]|nr:c-type cytochrome [Rhodocyclaceae bacterium]MBK6553793.1 c-type cytochrome [Rhodocyclaceae bacterium]MBK6678269.1 c-type cytochrome [Rhodocyclaceae bacterium]MBK7813584.1 c-type cytochrome [Rhodocyclaceae bacterium]MBK9310930.1 c-type cytochrome [Rhodocyclaceae bacterium]